MYMYMGLAVVFAALLVSCTKRHATIGPLTPDAPDYDRRVLETLLAHHQVEEEVLALCVQKASHTELKAFCEQQRTVQGDQAELMREFLRRWYAVADFPDPRPSRALTREYQTFLAQIRAETGTAFHEALLRGMRVHHRQGVREVQACESRGTHEGLRALCRDLNKSQLSDAERLNEWICRWYRDCLERRSRRAVTSRALVIVSSEPAPRRSSSPDL